MHHMYNVGRSLWNNFEFIHLFDSAKKRSNEEEKEEKRKGDRPLL